MSKLTKSLWPVPQENEPNLKQILAFYKGNHQKHEHADHEELNESFIFQKEELMTEQIMLPSHNPNNFIQFPRNSSSILKNNFPETYNVKQSILHANIMLDERKKKVQMRKIYSRENMSEMNKKHRQFRNHQYKQTYHKILEPQTKQFENRLAASEPLCSSSNSLIVNPSSNIQRKNAYSSVANRNHIKHQISHSMEKIKTARQNHTSDRKNPQNQHEKRSSMNKSDELQKFLQNRTINPLVVYPFETKMKQKRVDDNPKVLGSIIRKKFKQLDKEDLYKYINCLIKKRQPV